MPLSITPFSGDFAKKIMKEYNHRVALEYPKSPHLIRFIYEKEEFRASSLYMTILLNEIIQEEGFKILTSNDLSKIVRESSDLLLGANVDLAVVIRESNCITNNSLLREVREREIELPVIIPLTDLRIIRTNSAFGLGLHLKEDAEIVYAQIIKEDAYFSQTDINEKGLPNEISNQGDGFLYTSKRSFSRMFVSKRKNMLDLYTNGRGLFYQHKYNRILLVK